MVCQKLVEMNDGTIKISSYGINRGTVIDFTMRMCLARSSNQLRIEEEVKFDKNLDYSSDVLIAGSAEEGSPRKWLAS